MTPTPIRVRWCAPCIAVGVLMCTFATVAIAQDAAQPVFQINVYALVSGLLGLLLTACGAYVKGLNGRIGRTEGQVSSLAAALAAHQLATAQTHPTKADLDHKHGEVISRVEALHTRFDAAHFPSAFSNGRDPRQ